MMPRLPDKPSVATEAASIAKRFDREGTKVSSRDAKILLGRFKEAITSDDWGTISAREWRSAPWIWFIGEAPLADQPSFLDHLIRYFRSKPKAQHTKPSFLPICATLIPPSHPFDELPRNWLGRLASSSGLGQRDMSRSDYFRPVKRPATLATLPRPASRPRASLTSSSLLVWVAARLPAA